jgi:hypothetical protein
MKAPTLTNYPQRGYLIYTSPDGTRRLKAGWFHIEGTHIVRRKIGGRNTCSVLSIFDPFVFDADNKAKWSD